MFFLLGIFHLHDESWWKMGRGEKDSVCVNFSLRCVPYLESVFVGNEDLEV